MIILAVFGLVQLRHTARYESRYIVAMLAFCMVGIGSTMFHATLLWKYQLLDEIPMLYCVTSILYILVQMFKGANKCLATGLFVSTLALSLLYATIGAYILFLLLFVSAFITCFLLLWRYGHRQQPTQQQRMLTAATVLYSTAALCWITERLFCTKTQSLQLHALWHIGSGLGTFITLQLLLAYRAPYFKQRAHIPSLLLPTVHYEHV